MIKLEKDGASNEALEEIGRGKLRLAAIDGDIQNGSVMAGQVASMVCKAESCEEIISDLMEKAKNEINSIKKRFNF